MVSTLYRLDLKTLVWTLLWPVAAAGAESDGLEEEEGRVELGEQGVSGSGNGGERKRGEKGSGPVARYFHSAEAWGGDKIVIFAGEGYSPSSPLDKNDASDSQAGKEKEGGESPLCTLDDLWYFDTCKGNWVCPVTTAAAGATHPEPRYAHLGVITTHTLHPSPSSSSNAADSATLTSMSLLVILGGQDVNNQYLSSICVLNLDKMEWVQTGKWEKHIGTYRAVALSARSSVVAKSSSSSSSSLHHASHSLPSSMTRPEPIFVYSNYNFTDVRRDFDLLHAPLAPDFNLSTTSLARNMAGPALPPGLRFPTGTIIGHHMLVYGTYLSTTGNAFSIWALDLGKNGGAGVAANQGGTSMPWMRIDPGAVLARGSWNRAVGWENKMVVLGDRERDIAVDYDHRQVSTLFFRP